MNEIAPLSPIERHNAARTLTQSRPWLDYLLPRLKALTTDCEKEILGAGPKKCRNTRVKRDLLLKIQADIALDAAAPPKDNHP